MRNVARDGKKIYHLYFLTARAKVNSRLSSDAALAFMGSGGERLESRCCCWIVLQRFFEFLGRERLNADLKLPRPSFVESENESCGSVCEGGSGLQDLSWCKLQKAG